MAIELKHATASRVIINNIRWETYERFLKDLENRSSPRLAFNEGTLEIMSPSSEHEERHLLIASIVDILLEEKDADFRKLGSTTFKSEILRKGFEPDTCYYIQSVERIRGKKRVDLEVDPPPDLIIEVDLTDDSMHKFPIYAALRVPEVWRSKDALEIWSLDQNQYVERSASVAIPEITPRLIAELLECSGVMDRPSWLRHTRKRVRSLL